MRETAEAIRDSRPKQGAKHRAAEGENAQLTIPMAVAEPVGFEQVEGTAVYRALPIEARATLDVAILLRPDEYPTLEKAYQGMGLKQRFGLRMADLRRYAAALEAFARPLMAALTVAELLQALPRKFTARLGRANRLLVWSRLVQQVVDPDAKPLSATEFAKLADMLRAVRPKTRVAGASGRPDAPQSGAPARQLGPIVQQLYGLTLRDDDEKRGQGEEEHVVHTV